MCHDGSVVAGASFVVVKVVGVVAEGNIRRFWRATINEFDVSFGASKMNDLVVTTNANGGNGSRNGRIIFETKNAEAASCVRGDGLDFGKVAPSEETESMVGADRCDIAEDSRKRSKQPWDFMR